MKFFRYEFNAMGTPCDIQLFAKTATRAKQVAELAIADVRRLEMRYSRYRGDSFLSKINRVAATGGSISVDPETAGLLNYAATCYQQSDGLFDITSGILRRVWRFDLNCLPDDEHIQALLAKIGWHKLRWNPPVLEFLDSWHGARFRRHSQGIRSRQSSGTVLVSGYPAWHSQFGW